MTAISVYRSKTLAVVVKVLQCLFTAIGLTAVYVLHLTNNNKYEQCQVRCLGGLTAPQGTENPFCTDKPVGNRYANQSAEAEEQQAISHCITVACSGRTTSTFEWSLALITAYSCVLCFKVFKETYKKPMQVRTMVVVRVLQIILLSVTIFALTTTDSVNETLLRTAMATQLLGCACFLVEAINTRWPKSSRFEAMAHDAAKYKVSFALKTIHTLLACLSLGLLLYGNSTDFNVPLAGQATHAMSVLKWVNSSILLPASVWHAIVCFSFLASYDKDWLYIFGDESKSADDEQASRIFLYIWEPAMLVMLTLSSLIFNAAMWTTGAGVAWFSSFLPLIYLAGTVIWIADIYRQPSVQQTEI